MPKEYVTPNVAYDLQLRLQSITEQILSRSRLLSIVDEMKLYAKERSRLSPDEVVAKMRKDIDIDLVKTQPDNRISAFKVSYSASNPSIAQQVTNRLTTLFINENLEVRQEASEDTTRFLEGQLETVRLELEQQEEKIRAFKGQHVGELPAQLETNLQILHGLQSQLQSQEDALNSAKQQRVYLDTLLNQYRALQGTSKGPDGARITLASVDQELDKLRKQLADLSANYKDRYPDIRALKDKIGRTEKLKQELLATQNPTGGASTRNEGSATATTDATGSIDASLMLQLQSQLRSNQIEIHDREQSLAALRGEIGRYQNRLNHEPVREQELADLTRGYEQSKASYNELLKKKNESAMATRMELLRQGERFRVLDPASLPVKPSFPNRLRFCGLGLLCGIVFGLAIIVALEAFDDRIYNEADFKRLLPVPLLSEIPLITNPYAERNERKRIYIGYAMAGAVAVVILGGSALSYWRG